MIFFSSDPLVYMYIQRQRNSLDIFCGFNYRKGMLSEYTLSQVNSDSFKGKTLLSIIYLIWCRSSSKPLLGVDPCDF